MSLLARSIRARALTPGLWALALVCAVWSPALRAAEPGKGAGVGFGGFSSLPLYFEANCGQAEEAVRFMAWSRGSLVGLSATEASVTLRKRRASAGTKATAEREVQTRTVRLQFLGGNPEALVSGAGALAARVNYLVGSDPAKWRESVPTFSRVEVAEVYPGIKLVYYGNERQLEYDFVVAPGADPGRIAIRVRGADQVRIDGAGELVLKAGADEIRQPKPSIYQVRGGEREEIAGGYGLKDRETVVFEIGHYDPELPLVIDPVLSYSSYLGGQGSENGRAVAMDSSGNIYVAGATLSGQLTVTNALEPVYEGGYPNTAGSGAIGDAFVAKFDSTGSNLVYLTYLGGNGDDAATGIAVDAEGNAYITGVTDSTNFPTRLAITNSISGKGEMDFGLHGYDAFVTKLNPAGTNLVYSTYLGGKGQDEGLGIAVDSNFCAYVTGFTESTNFPTFNALQSTKGKKKGADVFVSKIASNGMSFVYSTYLGGTGDEHGKAIAVDGLGQAWVTGFTTSTNFPTINAVQPWLAGRTNAFVAVIDTTGSRLVESTYLGGVNNDVGYGIAVDAAGNGYVTGAESSGAASAGSFPVTPSGINPGGVFRSDNAGANWSASNAGLLHNGVASLAIEPGAPNRLYAGTFRGVARSIDGGATWSTEINTPPAKKNLAPQIAVGRIWSLGVAPGTPATVYAATDSGVFKSTDGGTNWVLSNKGLPSNPYVRTVAVDPVTPTTVYAGTLKSGVFKSTDAAATWKKVSRGLRSQNVRQLAIASGSAATLYATTAKGIFRSTDAGEHWEGVNDGLPDLDALSLAIDPQTNSTVFVSIDFGVFKSVDAGANWEFLDLGVGTSNVFVQALAIDPQTPATVYAGTGIGVYKSIDGGATWAVNTNGLPVFSVGALALNPATPGTVYAGLLQGGFGGSAFLMKLRVGENPIVYSSVFGGNANDSGFAVAVNPGTGEAFVAGSTSSTNFPTRQTSSSVLQTIGLPRAATNNGSADAFVAAVNADASAFLYSGYLGGRGSDSALGIAVDGANNVAVVGQTFSVDFPTVSPLQPTLGGVSDGFLSIIRSGTGVNVTIQTDPADLAVLVDGVTNATPTTLVWTAGSIHTVTALTQSSSTNSGIGFGWVSWSDGGAVSHDVVATSDTTLTASYTTQFLLTMSVTNLAQQATNCGGILSPGSGWFNPGAVVPISVTVPFGETFSGWVGTGDGSFSGSSNAALVTMNGPVSETAVFTGPVTTKLRVIINGEGSVSPNLNGKKLKVGQTYVMTATPDKGFAFTNWTGGATGEVMSSSVRLSFLMSTGLVLQANFVTNTLAPFAGNYVGLFFETNRVAPVSSGFLTAKLTDQGRFSAKLQLGAAKYRFSGLFNASGSFSNTITGRQLKPLMVAMQLDRLSRDTLSGQVSDGNWIAELMASRPAFSSRTNPAPQGGQKFTLIIPGGVDSLIEPGGDGSGSVTVDKGGNVRLAGTLGDGTKITQKTVLVGQNQWPFYVSLYSGNGAVIGWLTFTNEPTSDISGAVNWSKLGLPVTNIYKGGFALETEAVGSEYKVSGGQPVLSLPGGQGQLVLENGALAQNLTNAIVLESGNRVTVPNNTNGLQLSFTTSSGLFHGQVTKAGTKKPIKLSGAVLQKQNLGAGFFVNTNETGRVVLGP